MSALSYDSDRIERLEAATERLSQNVIGLSTSLALVSEINTRQSALEIRAAKAEARAVTKEDLTHSKREQDAITTEFRKNTLKRIYTFGIFAAILVVLGIAAAISREASHRADVKRQCQVAAMGATNVQAFVQSQLDIEKHNKFIDDALRAKRIASYTALGKAYPVPNCGSTK